MLVVLSDLHFTDGTLGEEANIPARAFEYLADDLRALIENERSEVKDVDVLLLGDIFDVLRSDCWSGDLMPWAEPGEPLEKRVGETLEEVRALNGPALDVIKNLKSSLGLPPEKVRLHYVPGNHDRTVNLFASTRGAAAEALGLDAGQDPFAVEYRSPEYGLLARHGQEFDTLNWGGDHASAGLGDAVVVKLINDFPVNLAEALDPNDARSGPILEKIRELDHVRPLWAIPRWLQGVLAGIDDHRLRDTVLDAWKRSVDGFLKEDFVRSFTGGWNPFRAMRWVPVLLRSPWGLFEKVLNWTWVRRLVGGNDAKFARTAAQEEALNDGIDFVAYGHTHHARQIPLDVRGGRRLVYFNTGTWRRTVRPAEHDPGKGREFIAWQVMSYLVFYRPEENRGYRYEMWEGMRGR